MGSRYNLQGLLASDIRIQIPADIVTGILSQPPFVDIQGVINLRDISQAKHSMVRSGFAYRSGTLAGISTEGRDVLLRQLGITTVFDLRHPSERMKSPSPILNGIETVWAPCAGTPGPLDLKDFAHGEDCIRGFLNMYLNIIKLSAPIFKKGLRAYPGCTAAAIPLPLFG